MSNGPSQAAQLLMATPGNFMEKVAGVIPLSQSTFNIKLLVTNLVLLVTIPIILLAITPKKEQSVEVDDATAAFFVPPPDPPVDKKSLPPAERLDRSFVLPVLIGAAGVYGVAMLFGAKGLAALDLNTLNFILLVVGMILHGNSKSFVESVQRGTATVYGVIIQFPLYAGIFGMISFSGLAQVITKFFIDISTPATFTWIVFLYTGIIDFFVNLYNRLIGHSIITDLVTDITTAFVTFFADILTKIGQWVTDFLGFFDGLLTDIGTWITDVLDTIGTLATDLFNVGKDIVTGLWDGLKDKWEDVKNWFSNVFAEVPEWIKKLLGISSPSKVFMGIGDMMMEGWRQGIANNAFKPSFALRDAASMMMNQVPTTTNTTYSLVINEAGRRGNVIDDFTLLRSLVGV